MGIGGLSKEFSDIFRRAFASRLFPPAIVEDMGLKHAKGILLYGPPGNFLTLKLYNFSVPQFVNLCKTFKNYRRHFDYKIMYFRNRGKP